MGKVARGLALLLLASLAATAAPVCRCLPGPTARDSGAGHECCAKTRTPALRSAACCPASPEGLTRAPAPPPPLELAGPAESLRIGAAPLPLVLRAVAFVAPSPPAPPGCSAILRV